MTHKKESLGKRVGKNIGGHFGAGVLVVVPIAITVGILYWLFINLDNVLQPAIEAIWGRPLPGVGVGLAIILVYVVGIIASNVFGKRLVHWGESLLAQVPIFRQLYRGVKQILESFSRPRRTGFMQVVLIEFPRKGMQAFGFVTNEMRDESGRRRLNVFIPTSPNPTTGFLQVVKEEEITPTNISVESALKMIVSAGRVLPKEVSHKIPLDS